MNNMIGSRQSWNNVDALMHAGLMGRAAIPKPELLNISESELFFYAFQICPLLYLLNSSENLDFIGLVRDLDTPAP